MGADLLYNTTLLDTDKKPKQLCKVWQINAYNRKIYSLAEPIGEYDFGLSLPSIGFSLNRLRFKRKK